MSVHIVSEHTVGTSKSVSESVIASASVSVNVKIGRE